MQEVYKMTSTERIVTAAQGKEPDRVPVMATIDIAWGWRQLYGPDSFLEYARDAKKMADVMVWTCKELGMDAVTCTPDVNAGLEAIAEASGLDYPVTYWKDYVCQHPYKLYEGDPLRDPQYGGPIVRTLKDAKKLVPANPYKHGRLPIILEAIELTNKELKGEWPIVGHFTQPLNEAGNLMGWTQAFMAMEKDLELWKTVEEVIITSAYEFAKAQVKAGVATLSCVTLLPHWIGFQLFSEKPVWAHADHPPELAERIFNEFGVGTGLHPCSVGPFEPGIEVWKGWLDHTPAFVMPEFGGADALARAKERLAPATVQGNIHPIDVMLHGSPTDVETACKELIRKCAPGGRYTLGPGCGLPVQVPIENVKAMKETVERYGYYPIRA
jgi:uroporphyrinogen decarboxylase